LLITPGDNLVLAKLREFYRNIGHREPFAQNYRRLHVGTSRLWDDRWSS
jgi:hypothetical protein